MKIPTTGGVRGDGALGTRRLAIIHLHEVLAKAWVRCGYLLPQSAVSVSIKCLPCV